MTSTLSQQGYRMPAEWEPHEATWLTWPHNTESWPGKLETVPPVYVEWIRFLTAGELVFLNVNDEVMEEQARSLLHKGGVDLSQVRFHRFPTNDSWMRDCGPIFLTNSPPPPLTLRGGEPERVRGSYDRMIVDWEFNKWGGKYPPWNLDNQIPSKISDQYGFKKVSPGIVMEGGSIEVNGRGTLITTTSCLLNKNRNPQLTQAQIEQQLKDNLGVTHILWLGDGIAGDDTDGHIDDITRFVNETTVVTVIEENQKDENYKPLQENLETLRTMKDQDGRSLDVITLPMPAPVVFEGQRLPASYANFYIANKHVIVPVFRDKNDDRALVILQECFPSRKVVGIDATDLIWGLGAFHCLSQQQPS